MRKAWGVPALLIGLVLATIGAESHTEIRGVVRGGMTGGCGLTDSGNVWVQNDPTGRRNYDVRYARITIFGSSAEDRSYQFVTLGEGIRPAAMIGHAKEWPTRLECAMNDARGIPAVVACAHPEAIAVDVGPAATFESVAVESRSVTLAVGASRENFMQPNGPEFSDALYSASIDGGKPQLRELTGGTFHHLVYRFGNVAPGRHEIDYWIGPRTGQVNWNVCLKT